MTPRSWLFVPGHSSKMMEKAAISSADALILDLEDAVAPDHKAAARLQVAEFLSVDHPKPRFVRVNALETGLTAEDVAAVHDRADGYVLPKCQGPEDLADMAQMIGAAQILAIATETVVSVRALLSRDWAHPALCGLAWGVEDLAADIGASENRGADGAYLSPFRLARDAMLYAAKAAGVAAVDAVYTDIRDSEGLASEARMAETVGFTAKLAIHPGQIDPIHKAFTPSAGRIAWARKVLEALEGRGVASLDGRMLDRPHLTQAQRILRRAPES